MTFGTLLLSFNVTVMTVGLKIKLWAEYQSIVLANVTPAHTPPYQSFLGDNRKDFKYRLFCSGTQILQSVEEFHCE